ncbi:hypothetical protein E1A91_A01G061700v1 [Gossypium mustelinum]|uniref:Uncharacterized protein n=1 Tax=Gossypium mustelinum TaxID=34275 RepID=A0A5D3AEW5_GOSMU|nr:hypothetical protein E1A91_A01G061700v1 [Gossypium mustelinum]
MEETEALDLLEESWFFENLLDRRRRMSRCYSDPCTSSNFRQDVLANDSCNNNQNSNGLVRAPSLPPCIGRGEQVEAKKNQGEKIKLNRQLSLQASKTTSTTTTCSDHKTKKPDRESSSSRQWRHSLQRTPSLPSSMEAKVSDIRMSKLIRQALADSPDILPPRHNHNKATNLPRCSIRPPRNQEVEAINNTNEASVTRYRPNPKKMLQKSYSDLAFQELQGFKDLGFTFDKEDLSPDVVNILPGLQGDKIEDELQPDKVRKPYLSEAWLVQGPVPPPIPTCVSKNSAQDMKAQIKFWARAVATNVRQEC